ncbi:DEAD/DEAH box helicase family protein [Synechococcus sp. CS-602]|uniref:type III restriction-modification system endonuclease n=1 Tax=Synechococcus sp. CS-602 TaxID=2847982 RepID=UPI00223BE7C1|nr:DEAD/DEAH box helicase family protein [Synechococcus sp. CS-602]MCT0203613.1 DEAD/DEAH box helicase family protein [Synechococcus sp. CS-602]
MKLHFEPNLDYQLQAIEGVCDLFHGQETCRTEFTVTRESASGQLSLLENDLGIGNRLTLLDDQLLSNLHAIQLRHGLAPSASLISGDFTVEMETGTGKTYVYLRTIFELNKRYGFTKFVIVVPSVAIKEGVYHTIETTAEHLKGLYAGAPFDFFIYDSAKLGQVRNFATSSHIQIMVMTVGAINKFGDEQQVQTEEMNKAARREKSTNVMYRPSEQTGGEKPINLIQSTRPILIVDEPQSVEGGLDGKGKKAMERMNPLCNLRYSATPKQAHHMVFKLDAVDAYERKLVKQIEVAAASVEGCHNKPFVRLLSVSNKRGVITAKVELDMQAGSGVVRREISVQDGDLLEMTTQRAVYHDFRVGEIRVAKGTEFLELRYPGDESFLHIGETYGDVEPLAIQRQMIKRTIKEHLDKEMRLRPQGIKVLSLFFIDVVDKYRQYDTEGNRVNGDYARIFEEEYRRLANHPDYQTLFQEVDLTTTAEEVHDGYFSIDKKKVGGKTVEMFKDSRGEGTTKADDDTYNLIMRDKEKLLSLDTPLKFIFSHSALREGWDNPNVFQICTLREMATEQLRRQTIGRGLRLCVNQQGERLRGFEINTLTVIATESYQQFAENLQKEIETDTGIRFGIVEAYQFAGISTTGADGQQAPLGIDQSKQLWASLKSAGFVNAQGKVQDALRTALKNDTLTLPEPFAAQLPQVKEILRKLAGRLEIKNADERRHLKSRQAVLQGGDFKALWDRIKHKTTYRVQFDNEALLATCIKALAEAPPIARTRLQWRKADIAIGRSGVDATEKSEAAPVTLVESDIELPDILTDLQDKTSLTRRSIYRILVESKRLDDFKRNPQQFIELAAEIIKRSMGMALVDGIKYQRIGDDSYYAQQLFESQELSGYLKSMIDANKSIHEQVIYQSDTERTFAEDLEKNEAIKVYAKLPAWFKISTPLGPYNPDWAVLVDKPEGERLYLVVETKSSLFTDDLRDRESAKINCGKAHFKAIAAGDNPAQYLAARSVADVLAIL